MRKTILPLLLAAVCATVACNKNEPAQPAAPLQEGPQGRLAVQIGIPETKAATSDVKSYQINKYQIMVFDGDKKETDRYVELSSPKEDTADSHLSTTITTKTGEKTVYVVVNSPRLKETSKSKLEAHLSDLSENQPGNIVMSGKNTVTVKEYDTNKSLTEETPVTVHVKRLASLITLEKVTVDFRNTMLEGGSLTIQKLYLRNVVGKAPLGVTGDTATDKPMVLSDAYHTSYDNWYNKNTFVTGAPTVTYDTWTKECTVAGDGTPCDRSLFAYPNKTSGDNHSETFSQRKTRLVIQASVTSGSQVEEPFTNRITYYAFDLPVLEANREYKITNINITMLGADRDNDQDETYVGRLTTTLVVDGWNGTTELKYEM